MALYRFDFFDLRDAVFATHEVAYESDEAAIRAAHIINGVPTIGAGFRVWRQDHLVYRYHNVLPEECPTPLRPM